MRSSLFVALSASSLFVTSMASAAIQSYKATLTGGQMVPPVSTTATGTATLQFDDGTRELSGTITFSGMTPTGGDIEGSGPCGYDGAYQLTTLAAPSGNTITLPATTLSTMEYGHLLGGALFMQLKSSGHPKGEIRGQIYATTSTSTCADGDAGAPPADAAPPASDSGANANDAGTTNGNDSGTSGADGGKAAAAQSGSGGCAMGIGSSSTGSGEGSALAALLLAGVVTLVRRKTSR